LASDLAVDLGNAYPNVHLDGAEDDQLIDQATLLSDVGAYNRFSLLAGISVWNRAGEYQIGSRRSDAQTCRTLRGLCDRRLRRRRRCRADSSC
jgi:hypothetical protein